MDTGTGYRLSDHLILHNQLNKKIVPNWPGLLQHYHHSDDHWRPDFKLDVLFLWDIVFCGFLLNSLNTACTSGPVQE